MRPFLKRDSSIDKLCKSKPINCNHLLNILWIKKNQKIKHKFPTFYLLTYAEIIKDIAQ